MKHNNKKHPLNPRKNAEKMRTLQRKRARRAKELLAEIIQAAEKVGK